MFETSVRLEDGSVIAPAKVKVYSNGQIFCTVVAEIEFNKGDDDVLYPVVKLTEHRGVDVR